MHFRCFFLRSEFVTSVPGGIIARLLKRNNNLAEMKPRVLAFRLGLLLIGTHVPVELWDVLFRDFMSPLCLP